MCEVRCIWLCQFVRKKLQRPPYECAVPKINSENLSPIVYTPEYIWLIVVITHHLAIDTLGKTLCLIQSDYTIWGSLLFSDVKILIELCSRYKMKNPQGIELKLIKYRVSSIHD